LENWVFRGKIILILIVQVLLVAKSGPRSDLGRCNALISVIFLIRASRLPIKVSVRKIFDLLAFLLGIFGIARINSNNIFFVNFPGSDLFELPFGGSFPWGDQWRIYERAIVSQVDLIVRVVVDQFFDP
jgi:hypothetical protein